MPDEKFSAGEEKALTANTFAKTNRYYFAEWNTSKNGDGKSYKDGGVISAKDLDQLTDYGVNTSITLYAIWGDKEAEYIFHSKNIEDDGTKASELATGDTAAKVITVPKASKIHVKIYQAFSPYTYNSYGCHYQGGYSCVWAGSHPDYTASKDSGTSQLGSKNGMITDTASTSSSEIYTKDNAFTFEGDIDGDTVTLAYWTSSNYHYSNVYGYYAVVTGIYDDYTVSSAKSLTIYGSWDE